MMERIVLAYSGGPDTSAAIPWLKARYSADVIAVTLDLGQGKGLEEIRDRALASGARRAHVLDLRDELASRYILPALKADAIDHDRYPMAASLSCPLIAEKVVEIAAMEQADAVACGGDGHEHFAEAMRTLNPRLTSIACPSVEARSSESDDSVRLAKSAAEYPHEPAYVELGFDRGVPASINGVPMPLVELIVSLGIIAGAHGVGRLDPKAHARARSRGIDEGPAAVVLQAAHQELQAFVTTSDLDRFCRSLSVHYASLIDQGLWFTPMRGALDAFVDRVQQRVTGVIRVRLFKGTCLVVGRHSPHSEYALQAADRSLQPADSL